MSDYVSATIKWLKDIKDHATRNALTELLGNLANTIRLNLASNFQINGTTVTATAAEINAAADVSGRVQELTASGAVTPGVQSLELNHATTTIAATIADASAHQGLFIVKATVEPGVGGDHTLTLTSGTFDGTNTVATFADINDALVVYFDSAGNGTILANVGTVGLA